MRTVEIFVQVHVVETPDQKTLNPLLDKLVKLEVPDHAANPQEVLDALASCLPNLVWSTLLDKAG